MVVVGSQATLFHTCRTSEVRSFSDEVKKLESVSIVNSDLAYDCPKTLNTYLLIVKNSFHIPSMQHNSIPPFIMWEAGREVNDVPMIHIWDEVTRESHSIILPQVDLRIPLWISGVFSYFDSRSLTDKEIEYCETMDLVLVTSDSKFWYPHCNLYSEQEENFLNFRGELKHPPEPKRRNIIDEMYYINYSIRDVEYKPSIDDVIYASVCVPVS